MTTTTTYSKPATHKSSISTKRYIELFSQRKMNFYYPELEASLIADGYSIPAYVRTMILEYCKADKHDKMHFCHKDFLTKYPEVEWNCYKSKKDEKRAKINWIKLESKLKESLIPYRKWWNSNGINLEESVKKFIGFLKGSSNKNLSFCIPGHLYRYIQGNTDELDDMTFGNVLITVYEGLLAEIDYCNRGVRLCKTSLYQWCEEVCNDLIPTISTHPKMLSGFDKIVSQLYRDRNTTAHGGCVYRDTTETHNRINDMVALYVHTVAKYVA